MWKLPAVCIYQNIRTEPCVQVQVGPCDCCCEIVLAVVAVSLHLDILPRASWYVLRRSRKWPSVGRYWQRCCLNSVLLQLKLLLLKTSILNFAKYHVMSLCCKSPARSLSLFDLCKLMASVTDICVCTCAQTRGHSHKSVVWCSSKRKNEKRNKTQPDVVRWYRVFLNVLLTLFP